MTSAARAEPFERRGEPVLHLGRDGRVVVMNAAAERAKGRLFDLVHRRMTTLVRVDQAGVDAALTKALADARPGLVTLTAFAGSGALMALVLPVEGDAGGPFEAVAALVVLIERDRDAGPDDAAMHLLRDAAQLTGREAQVVGLVAAGRTPREAADRLGIGFGTARLHLKSGYAKLGVHGQAELAALVRRLG